jgi:hypothetical protein
MAQTEPNEAAFTLNVPDRFFQERLTKREYFAAKAFQALITSDKEVWNTTDGYAQLAVKLADALIEELNKTK